MWGTGARRVEVEDGISVELEEDSIIYAQWRKMMRKTIVNRVDLFV